MNWGLGAALNEMRNPTFQPTRTHRAAASESRQNLGLLLMVSLAIKGLYFNMFSASLAATQSRLGQIAQGYKHFSKWRQSEWKTQQTGQP